MKSWLLLLALGLSAALPVGAQVVTAKQISLAHDDEGPGWRTSVTLAVPAAVAGKVLSFDTKKSTFDEVTDTGSGQPVKVNSQFMEQRISGNSREGEEFTVNLTVKAPPEAPCAWLKLKGTLVFNTVLETKKHKAVIKLVDGTSFKAGGILLVVKDVRDGGESTGFTLAREDGSFSPFYDIRFTDGEGNLMEVSRSGGGSSSRNNKIISESRSYRAPAGLDDLHAEFEMVEREGNTEVPFDIMVPVNP